MNKKEHEIMILMEECSEIIQIVGRISQRASKIERFGLKEIQPGQDLTNVERLFNEYADLSAMMYMVIGDDMSEMVERLDTKIKEKIEKVEHYLKYSEECGTLQK